MNNITSVDTKNRIEWLDLVRAIAILGVILCHSTEQAYALDMRLITDNTVFGRLLAVSEFTLGRIGVPLFLMSSGYLLLDRDYDAEKCRKFWKNSWLRLLIATLVWWVIYNIVSCLLSGSRFDIIKLIEELLFVKRTSVGSGWYMPMIIGLYILIPFAAIALKKLGPKMVAFPLIIFGCFEFGYPLACVLNNAFGEEPFALQFSLGFSGGAFGFYLILGYMIKKGAFAKIKGVVLTIAAIISFAAAAALQIWVLYSEYVYNVWYDNLFLLICSVCVFVLFSRVKKVHFKKAVGFIAQYSFAIYLIHYLLIKIFIHFTKEIDFGSYQMKNLIFFAVGLVGSIILSVLISRIPKVGKYILYLKK